MSERPMSRRERRALERAREQAAAEAAAAPTNRVHNEDGDIAQSRDIAGQAATETQNARVDHAQIFQDTIARGEVPELGPDGVPLSRRERRQLERSFRPMETWTAEEELLATGQIPVITPQVIAEQEELARLKANEAAQAAQDAVAAITGELPQVKPHQVGADAASMPPVEPILGAEVVADPPAPPVLRGETEPPTAPEIAREPTEPQPEPTVPPIYTPDAVAQMQLLAKEAVEKMERALQQQTLTELTESGAIPIGASGPVDVSGGMPDDTPPQPSFAQPNDLTPSSRQQTPAPMSSDSILASAAAETSLLPRISDPVVDAAASAPEDGTTLNTARNASPPHETAPGIFPFARSTGDQPLTPEQRAAQEMGGNAAWEAHPLTGATPIVQQDVTAVRPLAEIPRPDLSALEQARQGSASPFGPGVFQPISPPRVDLSDLDTRHSGLRRPNLEPAGGIKEYRWTHIAVLGALAFVLGVVVYHVMGFGN